MMVKVLSPLSEANRTTVAAVMVEEYFYTREAYADVIFSDENSINMMIGSADSALDRLYSTLDEEQFSHAEAFVQRFIDGLMAE